MPRSKRSYPNIEWIEIPEYNSAQAFDLVFAAVGQYLRDSRLYPQRIRLLVPGLLDEVEQADFAPKIGGHATKEVISGHKPRAWKIGAESRGVARALADSFGLERGAVLYHLESKEHGRPLASVRPRDHAIYIARLQIGDDKIYYPVVGKKGISPRGIPELSFPVPREI